MGPEGRGDKGPSVEMKAGEGLGPEHGVVATMNLGGRSGEAGCRLQTLSLPLGAADFGKLPSPLWAMGPSRAERKAPPGPQGVCED